MPRARARSGATLRRPERPVRKSISLRRTTEALRSGSAAKHRRIPSKRTPPWALKATTRSEPGASAEGRFSTSGSNRCALRSGRAVVGCAIVIEGNRPRSDWLAAQFGLEVLVGGQRQRASAIAANIGCELAFDLILAPRLLREIFGGRIFGIDCVNREIRDVQQPDALDPLAKIGRRSIAHDDHVDRATQEEIHRLEQMGEGER